MGILILCPQCPQCKVQSQIEMTGDEVRAMNSGKHIQEALPHWPAEQREMLITGIHPACWDVMFKDDEEDDRPLDGRMDLL